MFFPFSWPSFDFNLIWPDASLCILALWIGAAFLFGFMAALRMGGSKKVASGKYQSIKTFYSTGER